MEISFYVWYALLTLLPLLTPFPSITSSRAASCRQQSYVVEPQVFDSSGREYVWTGTLTTSYVTRQKPCRCYLNAFKLVIVVLIGISVPIYPDVVTIRIVTTTAVTVTRREPEKNFERIEPTTKANFKAGFEPCSFVDE